MNPSPLSETVTARPEYRDELQAILSRQVAPTRAEGAASTTTSMWMRQMTVSSFSTRTGEAKGISTST